MEEALYFPCRDTTGSERRTPLNKRVRRSLYPHPEPGTRQILKGAICYCPVTEVRQHNSSPEERHNVAHGARSCEKIAALPPALQAEH